MLQSLDCVITLLIVIVPNVIIWQTLKYFDLHEWLYIPRRSKFAQIIQFGAFLVILPFCYVTLYDLLLSLFISPTDYYQGVLTAQQGGFSFAWIIVVLNTILRDGVAIFIASFGIFIEFLQFWIKNTWVDWVVNTYPNHYKEILVQARQERIKWRTTHKTLPEFQTWVEDLCAERGWSTS